MAPLNLLCKHLCVQHYLSAYLGIGIEETNAGIGIPLSRILVRYRTNKMPDCVSLVRYRACSGIVSFFQNGTGNRTDWMPDGPAFRHFYIYVHGHWHGHAALTWTCNMDMDMQYAHGHGHAARLWSNSMYLDNGYAWMPEGRNADKEFSPRHR